MNANELLLSIINKINHEFEKIMDDDDNNRLIGNDISDDITILNYMDISNDYINALAKLAESGVQIHVFLKKSLLLLSILNDSSDIEITEEFNVCGVHRDLLRNIYIGNESINNQFLNENKILILEILHANFEEFIRDIKTNDDTAQILLYVAKAIHDNFEYVVDDDVHRLIFLSNCPNEQLEGYRKKKNELVAYLKLCILAEGLTFHKHFNLQNSTPIQNLICDTSKDYSQYNEILYILSEYNHSDDLLNKYFLLYTIIENFMYRKPIAQMLRSRHEFSIRDFKAFYSKIDSSELSKLKELFENIMDINYPDTVNVYEHIENTFNDFKTNQNDDLTTLIDFFKKIRVYNKKFELDDEMLRTSLKNKYFAEIVYQLRNSILHNTATEFHITHYELAKNEIIVNFLKNFMIPILEKIILHMIFTNNELISYKKNSLLLYGSESI